MPIKRIEEYTLGEIYAGLQRRVTDDFIEGKNPELGGIRWAISNDDVAIDQRVEFVCGLTGIVIEQVPDSLISVVEISCREFREVWNATSRSDRFDLSYAEWKARQPQP